MRLRKDSELPTINRRLGLLKSQQKCCAKKTDKKRFYRQNRNLQLGLCSGLTRRLAVGNDVGVFSQGTEGLGGEPYSLLRSIPHPTPPPTPNLLLGLHSLDWGHSC